jgi:hypothetical protein
MCLWEQYGLYVVWWNVQFQLKLDSLGLDPTEFAVDRVLQIEDTQVKRIWIGLIWFFCSIHP